IPSNWRHRGRGRSIRTPKHENSSTFRLSWLCRTSIRARADGRGGDHRMPLSSATRAGTLGSFGSMRSYLHKLFRRLLSGLVRLTSRSKSPWKRLSLPVPIFAFGPGSRREFARYFEGESGVSVESIDQIVEWLLTCQYVTDA